MNHYDVLIVGAGIGGLTCGARLAALGQRVAVFDHHYLPGGYATNFQRKGFTFDVALHGVGGLGEGQSFQHILKLCHVMDRIQPLPKEHPYTVRWGEEKIDIPQEENSYRHLLQERFPAEKEGIDRLFEGIRQLYTGLQFLSNPSIPGWKKGLLFISKCRILMKWSNLTTEQVIKQYVKSDEFISFFTSLWGYYGLPPQKLSSLYFFIPWAGYHLEGTFYIQGGSQALSNALAAVIEDNGGNVYLRQEVTDILIKQNQAYGVRTKKGLEFTGDWIVSNASPVHTLGKLVQNHPHTASYLRRLDTKEIGPSLTQLYIGLSCRPEELGIYEEDLLFVEEKDHLQDYQNLMDGDYGSVNFSLTNYNQMDPTLNQGNCGVMALTFIDFIENWPENEKAYQQKKQEVTEILLQRLEGYYPGIKERVQIAELGTPRTMERYTLNPKGAVYGFAQTVKQSGLKRTSGKTPFSHLSLVGAWTQPGGGFQGAATSGFMEAHRIHKSLQRNKKR